ncbi:hypothetical protein ABZT47_39535, partial [Sphaerisporangium sp. NPDC005289]
MDSTGRERVAHASRLVVKVGSSSLTTPQGTIDVDRVDALVDVRGPRGGHRAPHGRGCSGARAGGRALGREGGGG